MGTCWRNSRRAPTLFNPSTPSSQKPRVPLILREFLLSREFGPWGHVVPHQKLKWTCLHTSDQKRGLPHSKIYEWLWAAYPTLPRRQPISYKSVVLFKVKRLLPIIVTGEPFVYLYFTRAKPPPVGKYVTVSGRSRGLSTTIKALLSNNEVVDPNHLTMGRNNYNSFSCKIKDFLF